MLAARRILLIHPQGPGQFIHLAPALAARGDQVLFLGGRTNPNLPGIAWQPTPARPSPRLAPHLAWFDAAVRRGQATGEAIRSLGRNGFHPDLVLVHPGWGDALFLPELVPKAKRIAYAEFYYRAEGADVGATPETTLGLDALCRLSLRNAPLALVLEAADAGLAPTLWQRDLHPEPFRGRTSVIHDGVDLAEVAPDPSATLTLPDGTRLTGGDETVTYVARDLEPHRGFPSLMRALPPLLASRPAARVVICGGEGISYGAPPPGHPTWRAALEAEIGTMPPRVHFTGVLPRAAYLRLLQVSALHLYPSVPFVLSWSFTEALAAGALVLGSDTAPVREFIADGVNGALVDARDPSAIATRAAELLAARHLLTPWRLAARRTAEARFALPDCLSARLALIDEVLG